MVWGAIKGHGERIRFNKNADSLEYPRVKDYFSFIILKTYFNRMEPHPTGQKNPKFFLPTMRYAISPTGLLSRPI